MKRLLVLFFLAAIAAHAQNPSPPVTGQITAATTNATCANNGVQNGGAVDQPINAFTGAVGISVTGTWSATLNIQTTVDHGKTWTASGGTFAANQQSVISSVGDTDVCVFASAFTSGTAIVTFATSTVSPGGVGTGGAAGQVQGTAAAGSAVTGNPVLIGGKDNAGLTQTVGVNNRGIVDITQNVVGSDGLANNVNSLIDTFNATGGPLVSGAYLFNGTTWDRSFYCPNKSPVNVAATTTQIVALSGSTKIRICGFVLSGNATAGSFAIVEGTGTNCATGQTSMSGTINVLGTTAAPVAYGGGNTAPLITVAGDAVCVTATTTTATGFIVWEQH